MWTRLAPLLQNQQIQNELSAVLTQEILLGLSSIGGFTCLVIVSKYFHQAFLQLRGRGLVDSIRNLYLDARKNVWGIILSLPMARKEINAQVSESLDKLAAKLVPEGSGLERFTTLPAVGWKRDVLEAELAKLSGMEHVRWEDGRVSGAVYHGGSEMAELQTNAYHAFAVANPIHPDVFPGVRKMEAEIVAMVLRMFNAPTDGAGACTSGGTESILAACLSARERGRIERGIRKPEMILPSTAHPAFRKAGHYFGIKMHEVDCPAPTYRVNTKTVSRLVNKNTILIIGSAPNFPHGVVDDITELSRIAVANRTLLHVDCCLGSFMAAMLQKSGFDAPAFDFQLPGVTSISCDTHKYGFAPKGNSVVLYRSTKLRSYQYYIFPDWSGGVYVSQGMLGSRAGALIAGCWATMMAQGETGYVEACREIVGCAKRFEAAIRSAPLSDSIQVVGKPFSTVVAFTSETLNLWTLADEMSARGWHLNALQDPPAIHVAFTLPIVRAEAQLTKDLMEVVAMMRQRLLEPDAEKGTTGDSFALYGVAGSLPNKSVVVQLGKGYLDTLYRA